MGLIAVQFIKGHQITNMGLVAVQLIKGKQ